MADLVQLTVSVPASRVSDLYAYVATLHEPNAGGGTSKESTKSVSESNGNGFDQNTVRKNYFGGSSAHWRPFLDRLAEEPDEWVAWKTLCGAIGMDAKPASGMLGAAERRCHNKPPYEKRGLSEGDHWFRMPKSVADLVKEFAAE